MPFKLEQKIQETIKLDSIVVFLLKEWENNDFQNRIFTHFIT
jgi:hypothetical protein